MKIMNYDGFKLSKDLEEYLINTGRTMKSLSPIVGLDPAVISKIKAGKYYPNINNKGLQNIIKTMGKSIDDYISGDTVYYDLDEIISCKFGSTDLDELESLIEKLVQRRDMLLHIQSLEQEIAELKSQL